MKIKDVIWKISVLFVSSKYWFIEWRDQVWRVDLDEQVCCSGLSVHFPCGCMGTTHRQQINWQWFQKADSAPQFKFEDLK